MNDKTKGIVRLQFLDILKLVAVYLVIFYHSSPTMAEFSAKPQTYYKYFVYFLHGLASIAVPTFFLVNGFLLLNKTLHLQKHLLKTFRIYILTLVWSVITVTALIKIEGDRYSLSEFIKAVLFLKLYVNNHLWFLFSLVSVYILFPVVKVAFDAPDRNIILWALVVVFVSSFGNLFGNWCLNILYVLIGHPIDIIEAGKIKEHLPLSSQLIIQFSGYYWVWVYFIIGGLLGRRNDWYANFATSLPQLSSVFLISLTGLFLYGVIVSPSLGGTMFDNGWDGYYSIPCLLMTLSMFLAARRVPHMDGRAGEFIASIGTNTLGIYFIHLLVIKLSNPYVYEISSSSITMHLLYSLFILIFSWIMAVVLRQIPLANYLVKL